MSSNSIVVLHRSLDRISADFRDALWALRSGRERTTLAFLVLALSMAAGTVTFSVVDAVTLRPLPYGSPDRLVGLSLPGPTPGRVLPASPRNYFEWLEGTQAFESLGAARIVSPLSLEADGAVEMLSARSITANLFDVLGVRPPAGRFFGPEHERLGGPAGVLLSHDVWVRRFAADPAVIGRALDFGQERLEVVGIVPAGVWYPINLGPPPDLYIPYVVTNAERSSDRCCMFVVGRLRPGVSVEQARGDVGRVSAAVVLQLHDQVVGPAKTWLLLVLAAAGFVLLVACVNVAILFLGRAATRSTELATRAALGASRRRLAGGLLLEGLILSLASAAAAMVLSFWGVGIAKSILPPGLTRVSNIAVDGRILSVSIAVAVLCGLVFAGAPAWMIARQDLVGVMNASGGALVGGRRRNRALSAFLAANIAFVGFLLVASTLVVTSFIAITTTDLGFDRRNVMSVWYERSLKGVAKADRPAAVAALRAELLTRAESVPGVTHAAILNSGLPMSGARMSASIVIPGYGTTTGTEVQWRAVTSDYFRVMGMQIISGRQFEPFDRAGAPLVALINEVAARRFFPGRDPVGQAVTFFGPRTIVGVLRAVHSGGPEAEMGPEIYTPLDQQPYIDVEAEARSPVTAGNLVVRTSRNARGFEEVVREAIRPALGVEPKRMQFIEDDFRRLTAGRRFNAGLMATFGIIAVAIAAIGVYGTIAFFVAQQIRATGLRMAFGASPARVMRSVLRDALRPVGLGALIGLAGAWAVSRAFTSFVFGIRPTEPAVYVAVGGFLAVVGFAAAFVPALRAARLDPLTALRHE